jgi:hypothetical protein
VPESTTSAILWGTGEGAKDALPHRVTVPPKKLRFATGLIV